jgi:hypothetical protein
VKEIKFRAWHKIFGMSKVLFIDFEQKNCDIEYMGKATKAIGNGVKIKCVRDSMISYYENSTLIDTDGFAIRAGEILKGKWYIIE